MDHQLTFVRIACVAVYCSLVAGCLGRETELPRLQQAVGQRVDSRDSTPIALGAFTPFSWDRVYIFKPYTTNEEMLRVLGGRWKEVAESGIEYRDDAVLFVFVRSGDVVGSVMYPRAQGDFAGIRAPGGLTPREALFLVRLSDRGRSWAVLELTNESGEAVPDQRN